MKNGKQKRLISFFVAVVMIVGLITVPAQEVKAEEILTTDDLIISEYLEGSSNNKAIELYNGTGEVLNLAGYSLELYANGKNTVQSTLKLEGNLENGKTYVISHKQANDDIKDKSQLQDEVVNFNGNDTILLKKEGTIIDSFGQFGVDPGKSWSNNGVSTVDMTLIRKETVSAGDSEAGDEFDPSIEWTALNKDDSSNLGLHHNENGGGTDPQPPTDDVITLEAARNTAIGEKVIVRGVVSFNDRNQTLHIQDETGAIAISNFDSKIDLTTAVNGSEVEVIGVLKDFNKLLQIQATEITVVSTKGQPDPKVVTIKELKEKNFDSHYVEIKNATIDVEAKTLTEGEDILDIYFIPDGLEVKTGDIVDVKGTVGRFKDTVQIYGSSCTFTKVGEVEPPTPEEDKVGPEVTSMNPRPGSATGENKKPEISATFEDPSGVNMDSIKMWVDETEVTSKLVKTENTVKFAVEKELEEGKHTVKVEVKDSKDNLTSKEWTFTVGVQNKNLYFGQLHSHTNLSDGQGSIDEAYTYARDNANLDFFAVTDHSNWFDNDTKGNIADGSASNTWKTGQTAADKYNKDGEFTAIYGYEMTWSGSTGGYGHMNTFNTPGFETRSNKNMNLQKYYDTLKTQEQSISQFNHPGKTFGDFSDFGLYDGASDDAISLLEVGNGEGPVRGSGYFPSYEYYTRALDKGWHVAPTNNQDNHKGLWGNSNTAKTVVEASELTRESLYDALENRRVYSTEDENLRVSYEVNGQTMGSILPETDSLAFNINVEDIDSGDNIKKISIIGDAGRVIKSIDNINSTSKNWTFTLDSSESSYYYVKVEQADKDIAVTSAIWVGEKENVGISTVDSDSEVITVGDEFKILTTIYNNEAIAINNIRIEYYLNDKVDPIKTEVIDKLDSAKTVVAELPYTVDKAGEYTFTVKVTATVNGTDKEFVGKKTVEVVNASEISKVVIDGTHQNQYVTGDYAGKITTLTALMAQNNIKGIINDKPITDEVLEGVSLLILSDPQSTSKPESNLEPHKYSQEELAAIARYVEKGGNIAITSKADYGDAIGEYGNAAQGNSVLEAIGAKLRFNDDQATDKDKNGGQEYRLYFTDYNTNSKWLDGIDTTKEYSFYSGSTLIMPSNLENIEVLVRGHKTTYGNDADNQKDNTPVEKGDVVGLAVETLSNGSKIIVSGATFFSNFEMDGLDYSNYQITEKVLKELAAAPELPVSNIADVRVDKDEDNNPDRFGETVVVEGYVTAASNLGAPGNSFFDVIYVQDGTAGLTVFGVSTTNVKLGQKVRIKGRVSSYLGDAQIALKNEETGLQIIDANINLVEPTKLSTKDSMLEEKEGLLVKVEGTVTRIEGQNIYVNDGSGESRVYTEGYIGSSTKPGVADEWKTRVKVGDSISAIGLASEDPEGHRLRVRDSAEIVVTEVSKEDVEINILHTNDSHGRVKADSKVIGIDTIAAIKNSLENSLLVDAGDTLHGLPFATMNRGSDIVELMKMSGYDLMAPGNHDFNYGYERLLELAKQAQSGDGFDIISANVLKDGKSILDSNNIKEINGVKVGFFGLTSPETTYKTNPNNVKGLEFADPIKTAEAQVKALKAAGADVVIALAHIGTDESTEITSEDIAKEVKGIDVIIDGHSHSKFENGFEAANGTLIVSTGEYEENLGKLTLTVDVDSKKLVTKTATLISKDEASKVTPDAEVSDKIAKIDAEQSVLLSEVIGTNITELDGVREHVRAGETNLGNLITDSMLYTTGAEIAITNGGGIRASINVGEITKGEVIEVLPFGNFIVTKYLTGKQIKDVLEHGVKDAPALAGQFPHVAGINFIYDVNQPVGSKIVKITVNGEKIDMDKQYLVATNDFIAASGDGYPHFGAVKTENEFSALDEALASYVKELKAVDYKLEGRITVGTAEEVEDTENKVIADKVIEQIKELPEISKLTLSDKEKVIAARAAYNALTDDQKALVPQKILDMLVAAEAKIAELEKEEEEPEIPVNPEKPGDGNGSGNGNNNNNNQGSDEGKGDLPQTGGNNSMYFLIFGLLMIGTGAIVVFKKKSKIKEAK